MSATEVADAIRSSNPPDGVGREDEFWTTRLRKVGLEPRLLDPAVLVARGRHDGRYALLSM
jgi:hypothetical protein